MSTGRLTLDLWLTTEDRIWRFRGNIWKYEKINKIKWARESIFKFVDQEMCANAGDVGA